MSQRDQLPYRATVQEYEEQAKTLWQELKAGEEAAFWRCKWVHPRFRGQSVGKVKSATLGLDDARQVIACEYSFDHWNDLIQFAGKIGQGGSVDQFEAAVEALVAGDEAVLRQMLADHPELAQARSSRRHHATLLHYLGANGVESSRQKTPANAVAMAKMLLEAGAEVDALADLYDNRCTTMSLIVSSSHPAKAGLQAALAETLLDHGAALDGPGSAWKSAVMTALMFGYLDTAKALAKRSGPMDHLPLTAGLGQVADTTRLLGYADAASKHAALALAAQHGHVDIVRLLLDAGEDPNRYNPEGFHSHSAPIHQAVAGGHMGVVRLLVERGARPDLKDKVYEGTPLGWAEHCEQPAIAKFLRDQGTSDC